MRFGAGSALWYAGGVLRLIRALWPVWFVVGVVFGPLIAVLVWHLPWFVCVAWFGCKP
jgi:hypothetical protein